MLLKYFRDKVQTFPIGTYPTTDLVSGVMLSPDLPLQHPKPLAVDTYLPRKHRALVALYSLAAGHHSRESILAQNHVSEADLAEFEEDWKLLRRRSKIVV